MRTKKKEKPKKETRAFGVSKKLGSIALKKLSKRRGVKFPGKTVPKKRPGIKPPSKRRKPTKIRVSKGPKR